MTANRDGRVLRTLAGFGVRGVPPSSMGRAHGDAQREVYTLRFAGAMLAEVNGAVVMTDRLEILGFGAEISGAPPDIDSVDRSLDLKGEKRSAERTEQVGSRPPVVVPTVPAPSRCAGDRGLARWGHALRALASRQGNLFRSDRDRSLGSLALLRCSL